MSGPNNNSSIRVDDGFERHYAEKIWALIPEVYRNEDGVAVRAGQLRALVEILAKQAAIARRSVDRLRADTRADEADDWAIPYIGALIGARPVSALNRPGQRANLARTILYRRRQGTVRLLELLADDIADWDGVASESFKRLLRHWHMLDGGPPIEGTITRSPQWGYADLRNVRIGEALNSAHDDLSHAAEFRRHRGVLGRYNIQKVNLHLFRQYAFPLSGITPFPFGDGYYTLDPSGRDIPLFQVGGRESRDCTAAREWEMRAPIPCHRLNAASFRPERAHAPVELTDLLEPIYGRHFTTEAGLLEAANAALTVNPAMPNTLSDAQVAALIQAAMELETPRHHLLPGGDPATLSIALSVAPDFSGPALGPQHLYGANLAEWAADHGIPSWVRALVDPQRGRVRLMAPLTIAQVLHVQRIYYGIFWPIGAGTHDRASGLAAEGFTPLALNEPDFTEPISGEFRFMDSRTYRPLIAANGVIETNGNLFLTAANGQRPYVVINTRVNNSVTLHSTGEDAELVIDGLWLAVIGTDSGDTELRIEGAWRKVTLRNITIDPGGERASGSAGPIPAVTLVFGGAIDDIVIDSAITGPIAEAVTSLDPGATDTVSIRNAIVFSEGGTPALLLRNAQLSLDNATVFGNLVAGRLIASQVLVDGQVLVEDGQSGCFRFSAASAGGRVPHPYESHFFPDGLPAGTFVSRRFGDPGYAQITEIAPPEIRTGGENDTEMGAFNRALDPIKRADLAAKLEEFMPINAIAQLVFET
ncbi:hypothetical protein [Nitrosospira sp. Nsp13]|uniref:hypothetical protein n=1 Tax=Nitrosospira sp. Nsp13 TaxID=1855332 RepID=UPI000882783C|nr:hypothetical protein [Nitrosospira sp. Nsp13]SCX79777.1 hypothetical protein SAMN05216308_101290 [Nitrosospira sp. Nsp13]